MAAAQSNRPLARWMAEHGMTAPELADAVNDALGQLTGRTGSTSERSVFRWLSGKTRWPQERQRLALEAVTGQRISHLGFVPRGKPSENVAQPEEGSDVHRRQFLGAAASTAAAAIPIAPPACARPLHVGTADVIRLRQGIERLVALDDERGGQGLESVAVAGAAEALDLQGQSATQRVRQRLFALATDYTAQAAWSRIDAGQLDGVEAHLERALTLAGLAQDSERAMQVWNLRAMLARQRQNYSEAVASAQAAQVTAVARRSPLHASLAYARTAVCLAHSGQARPALRHLARAEDALGKADLEQPRASWLVFYGPAELHSLTAIVRDEIGHPAEAEAASHQALAALAPSYRRNRAHTTARLALAQLHQGEIEQACETSGQVFTIMAGTSLPGRMRQLIGDFQRDLIARAPAAVAHEWMDQYRTEWSGS
ncbi:XRE family transcriptional regulator [Streptomyces microflavus]|uniref:XRE family transcriptional regulator n=1 Tax=Streptomyces microflavus TaxID=1919 RepID=UPI001E391748|nr:XRE family transcriptional regulator [Streptomyces microflavus]